MVIPEIEKQAEKIRPIQPPVLLISQELARRYNIPAESPVFVSPDIVDSQTINPKLQVYQVGYAATLHHFSREEEIGIKIGKGTYFGPPVLPEYIEFIESEGGLPFVGIATLEPGSKVSDSLIVENISLYCRVNCCARPELNRLKLTEGLIVSSESNPGILIPVCGALESIRQGESVQYNFKAVDKSGVVFTSVVV